MGIGELSGKPDDIGGGGTLQWTSIPWGGGPYNGLVSHGGGESSDTPSRLCYGNQDDL